jgi:hypothetical protein
VTIVTTVLIDDAEKTVTRVTDDVLKRVSIQTAYKTGTPQFNQASLASRAQQTITDCDTAEALIQASGWDALTANQRKAITLGLVQATRAAARLILNQSDSPS